MYRFAIIGLLALVAAASLALPWASGDAAARGPVPLYRVEVTESFNCKDQQFCEEIFELPAINHESAVLYSDGTAHNEFDVHCRTDQEPFCAAQDTLHISQDFNWFTAAAECGEEGCQPVEGSCTPDPPFLTCTPFFWRDKPETWTVIGCAELSPDSFLCQRRGSPPVTIVNPIEAFGFSYPDLTFWPAVPGHYVLTSPDQFGDFACEVVLGRCPPPGDTVQVQVTRLR